MTSSIANETVDHSKNREPFSFYKFITNKYFLNVVSIVLFLALWDYVAKEKIFRDSLARPLEVVDQLYRLVLLISAVIMTVGTVICLAVPGKLMGLFSNDPQTVIAGESALRIISAGFIVSAVSVTSSGALEGLGKGVPSLMISLCRYLVIIVPAAFLLSRWFGPDGVWNAFWVTELLTAAISFIIWRKSISRTKNPEL
mgnify:CR=1 FL=1